MIPYTALLRYNIYGFKVSPEAIATVLAFTVFFIYVASHLRKERFSKQIINPREFAKFVLIIIVSSILGGRAWYYFIDLKWRGWSNIIWFIDLRNGEGLVSMGMILGGFIGLLIYVLFVMKEGKNSNWLISLAKLADIIAPAIALYIFIFRLFGCSIVGDTIGTKTAVPWALYWTKNGVPRHPTSFYLALKGLFIFFILRLFFSHKKIEKTRFRKRFDGEIILWFLLLYCFNRLWIEFFRIGKQMYGPMNLVQWICLFLVIFLCQELFLKYYVIKKLRLNSLYKYADWIKANTWLRQHKIFWQLLFKRDKNWHRM